jgi:hypothetical protein
MNKLAKYAMVEREKKRTNWETVERNERKYFCLYFLAGWSVLDTPLLMAPICIFERCL